MDRRKTIPLLLLGIGIMLIGIGLGFDLLGDQIPNSFKYSSEKRNCVEPARVSFDAPALSLHTLDKQSVSLEEHHGKVILLNTWATWCPPCLAELPDLEAFARNHIDDNFVLIGINIGEQRNKVIEFLELHPVSFPIWLDPDETTLQALNTMSLPYSIVIDQTGDVRLAWSGATCLETLESAVAPMLRQ